MGGGNLLLAGLQQDRLHPGGQRTRAPPATVLMSWMWTFGTKEATALKTKTTILRGVLV